MNMNRGSCLPSNNRINLTVRFAARRLSDLSHLAGKGVFARAGVDA
jgi:hypothetical protein